MNPLRIYFDTEFMEDGLTIDPLSFGFITDKGDALYIEVTGEDISKANDMVKASVLPHLAMDEEDKALFLKQGYASHISHVRCTRDEVAAKFMGWLDGVHKAGQRIEFWAGWPSYDWVLFCQRFGAMMDMPRILPFRVNDVIQLAAHKGYLRKDQLPAFPKDLPQHNALADAAHVRMMYDFLT